MATEPRAGLLHLMEYTQQRAPAVAHPAMGDGPVWVGCIMMEFWGVFVWLTGGRNDLQEPVEPSNFVLQLCQFLCVPVWSTAVLHRPPPEGHSFPHKMRSPRACFGSKHLRAICCYP